jgi:hypothetical protein
MNLVGMVSMYAPAARERVRIAGSSKVFLVVYVDREQGTVDLIPLHNNSSVIPGISSVITGIAFSQLEPYREDISLESA